VEVIFGTWSMPEFTPRVLDSLPRLKALFYAAGSVNYFARPLMERGVLIVSAWQANAIPVAEYTLAQILLATKGYFHNVAQYTTPDVLFTAHRGRGNFGETIALLGCGAIGSRVAEHLKSFHLTVKVYDPFLSDERATALGVSRASLEQAFAEAYVVSNHLPDLPETRGILSREHFQSMRPHATFINTGRGITVDEPALIEVLQERPDLTALLDVAHPEPPPVESPLYTLPNAHLTTHIAGSIGDEVIRMADYCLEDLALWQSGKAPRYSVSLAQLQTMA
jgi:phosphoglycerate dehydrogenase-like enzyme